MTRVAKNIRIFKAVRETLVQGNLLAIAVPIYRDQKRVGAINMLFPAQYLSPKEFAAPHLEVLSSAANQISTDLARF